jgi:hypothetical protein
MMLGCFDVYLWHKMIRPDSDVVFVGDARNVVACYFICQQMCRLLKSVRLNWRKQQVVWGRRAELDEASHRYTQRLAEGIMENGIFIGCTAMQKNIMPGRCAELAYRQFRMTARRRSVLQSHKLEPAKILQMG